MNRLVGHQPDLLGGPTVECWSAGRPPKPIKEPGARRRDPDTSKAAAEKAKDLAAKHHGLIFECLARNGKAGKDAIARLTGLTGVQVGRRMHELAAERIVKPTGARVLSSSGRLETEWEVA